MSDTFSIDEAVESLHEGAEVVETPVEAATEPVIVESEEFEEIPGDQPGSEEAAETPAEDAGGVDEAPETAAEAPAHWSAEGKAVFASLNPEAQAAILAEAVNGQKVVDKKLQETAEERKAAKAERESFSQLREQIVSVAERASNTFAAKWEGITPEAWAELARTKPQEYTALRAQHDADQQIAQQAQSAREKADAEYRKDWLSEQQEALKTLAPELVDPEKGAERLTELGNYITAEAKRVGASVNLPEVGALEMSIARKAMLYDQGVEKLTKPTQPAPSRPAVKPSAVSGATPQQRSAATVKNRFVQAPSIDNAVELLLARQG